MPKDVKAYAWAYDGRDWQLLPRNEARIFNGDASWSKQLTGTLVIDGCYAVPVISSQNALLLFRKQGDFKTFTGLPAGETGFEVTKLDVRTGYKKGQLIRTAQLQRLGESAATFGAKREPIIVQKLTRQDGIFHAVTLARPLPPGRYALYLPDRAFEFEVR